jgi:hypothetical protein
MRRRTAGSNRDPWTESITYRKVALNPLNRYLPPEPLRQTLVDHLVSQSNGDTALANNARKRALMNCRKRLSQTGLARFEVLGLASDRDLILKFAKRLIQNDDATTRLRADVLRSLTGEPPPKGGVLATLQQSPLIGAELDVSREVTTGRGFDP